MKGYWVIVDNRIAIQSEEVVVSPSSDEIYSFYSKNEPGCVCGIECNTIQHDLCEIRISKIGLPIKGRISSTSSGNVEFTLYTEKRGKSYNLTLANGSLIDHCLVENSWHYLSGNLLDTQDFLTKTGIKEQGQISFKQYLKAVELLAFNSWTFISNEVDVEQLKSPIEKEESIPLTLKANLYPYQRTGFQWLKYMIKETGGCILGDEMGLGKTMQVIATMLYLKSTGLQKMLVVAPISLLANWERECNKFAPSLSIYIHYGKNRISNYRELLKYDVIITSYTTVVSDIHMLNMIVWNLVVLDEAQNIKTPTSQRTIACKAISRINSIAVSGTPFENHVSDIWSLIDFVTPDLLGSIEDYTEAISDDVNGAAIIEPILSPLMIRRLVKDVAKDLPEKVVSTQPLQMSEEECIQYNLYLHEILEQNDSEKVDLGSLQKLRIYCTHPFAVNDNDTKDSFSDPYSISIKYQRFCEISNEVISQNEKIIVFTSYKRMFDIFKRDIPNRFGIKLLTINGETPVSERQKIVDHFNGINGSAMLILNPRAAGTGLNITGANHVIHYNLEWNPSLEDQSTARAYRRGQEKTVFVYRLYYRDTIEEIVNERILRKRDISTVAVIGTDGISQDRKDIIAALKLAPSIKH